MKPGILLPSLRELRWVRGVAPAPGKFVVLDLIAHWSDDELKWRGPTTRMARAWSRDVAFVETLVWEQTRGKNLALARELPHPRVAVDTRGALGRWLEANGADSLPMSLLFSRAGKLVFSGQPFELPEVLETVRAGRWFFPEVVYALQQKREAEAPERGRLVAKITALEKEKKWREAITQLDNELGKFVPEHQGGLLVRRFKILHKNSLIEALDYAEKLESEPISRKFPWLLHDIALEVADKINPSKTEVDFALGLMERLLKINPTRPSYWDTLAELREIAKDNKGAWLAQSQAVRFLDNQLDLTDSERDSIREAYTKLRQ